MFVGAVQARERKVEFFRPWKSPRVAVAGQLEGLTDETDGNSDASQFDLLALPQGA